MQLVMTENQTDAIHLEIALDKLKLLEGGDGAGDIFLLLHKSICSGYSLELPH